MTMSPQLARAATFTLVKKGYDPNEVDAFKADVAASIEDAQNQAAAMEARARAAVAKLQEVAGAAAPASATVAAPPSESETISRTLLLAQRTADTTVAEAKLQADAILSQARNEASRALDAANATASRTLDEARADARRAADDERVKAENEVQALLARRDFLLADVDHLEQYVGAQRERLRDAAVALHDLVERVPGGLAEMRRPLLSASAPSEPTAAPAAASAETAVSRAGDGPTQETDLPPSEPSPAISEPVALFAAGDASTAGATADDLWRMLDEPAAAVRADRPDVDLTLSHLDTAEVPVVDKPATAISDDSDRFSGLRIGGDELQ